MIFNKDKKNLSKEIFKNSVEDTAIDRWRTINQPEDNKELNENLQEDPNFKER